MAKKPSGSGAGSAPGRGYKLVLGDRATVTVDPRKPREDQVLSLRRQIDRIINGASLEHAD